MKEVEIQRQILQRLALVPEASFMRNSIDSRGKYKRGLGEGSADIIGVVRGRFVALEVKRPGERQRPAQLEWASKVILAGGVYSLVTSVEEAVDAVMEARGQCR